MAEKETETDQITPGTETDKVKHETNMANQDQIIVKEDSGDGMVQPDEETKDSNDETINEKTQDSSDETTNLPKITSQDVTEQKKPPETPSLTPGEVKADPEDESSDGPHIQPCGVGSKNQADENEVITDEVGADPKDGSPDELCGVEDIKSQAEGGLSITELKKTADSTKPQILDEIKDDEVDASTEEPNIQLCAFGDITNIAGGDHKQDPEPDSCKQKDTQNIPERQIPVEGIHTVSPETDEHTATDNRVPKGSKWFLSPMAVVIVATLVAVVLLPSSPSESPRQENRVDVFLSQMERVQARFPHQRADLWKRSRIHLQRHFQTAQPTAPVILILTAGLRAEKTLRCLAQGLASTFSLAHNASILHIEGAGTVSQDSDQVKLDIDSKLQDAFEGDKPAAIIHRFDELPPGSTLIFYRYCDHENAAYKEKFLIFTVLLEEEEIPAKVHLNAVEEMVDDHLKKKFLSHDHPVSFDRMDIDKYGGLWSRISHLILPVAAEGRVEHGNC